MKGSLARWPLALVGVVYLVSFAGMPAAGFWTNDNGLKFIQVQELLASGFRSFDISWPGAALDPELRFAPVQAPFAFVSEGALYPSYSPIFAALSAPFFAWLGFAGLSVLPLAGALLTLPAVRRLGEALVADPGLRRTAGTAAVLLAGLGTPLWFYGLTFWEHTPAVALSCWSLVACIRQHDAPGWANAALVGGLAGLAVWFRTDGYLFAAAVLCVCVLRSPERRLATAARVGAAFVLALTPAWILHAWTTGSPLGVHVQSQGWLDLGVAEWAAQRADVAWNILLNAHETPWLSAAIAAPFLALAAASLPSRLSARLPALAPAAAAIACMGGAVAIYAHLTAQLPMRTLMLSNGLFAVSPALIFAFLLPSAGAPRARATLLWVLVLYVGGYATLLPGVNSRGLHWGCRFVLPAYPVLAALAAAGLVTCWKATPRRAVRALFAVTLALSFVLQLHSLLLLHARKSFSEELVSKIDALEADLIVTPLWFLGQDLAPVFYERPVFLVRRQRDLHELYARARRAGAESALLVTRTRRDAPPAPQDRRISDGWLRYVDLRARVVALEGAAGE